jgi:hypothetical protein
MNVITELRLQTQIVALTKTMFYRFTAICHPLYAKSLVTTSKTVKALIGAWMCAVAMGVWRCFNLVITAYVNSDTTLFHIIKLCDLKHVANYTTE